jgi:hypothetical protein
MCFKTSSVSSPIQHFLLVNFANCLRKGVAYCRSIEIAALPKQGKFLMEKWLASPDKDIRCLMKENLKKDRLKRMDSVWVAKWER